MTDYLRLLDEADLRARGIPAPWAVGRADRVRFHELDALNHVNNATYFTWFETLRLSFVVAERLAYYASDAPVIVLKSTSIDYRKPVFLDQDYVVAGRVREIRRTSFVMDYAIFTDDLAAIGEAVHVLFEADSTTRRALPDATRARWIALHGAEDKS